MDVFSSEICAQLIFLINQISIGVTRSNYKCKNKTKVKCGKKMPSLTIRTGHLDESMIIIHITNHAGNSHDHRPIRKQVTHICLSTET